MTSAVWKFPLRIEDEQVVSAPAGWRPLSAARHGGAICLWAVVDIHATPVECTIQLRGTGQALGTVGQYVATVIDTPFVWHVFAGRSSPARDTETNDDNECLSCGEVGCGGHLSAADVIFDVAQRHNLRPNDILGPARYRQLVMARREIAHLLRAQGWSYPKIGRALGGRDHSTAMNLCGALRSPEAREAAKVRQATRAIVGERAEARAA